MGGISLADPQSAKQTNVILMKHCKAFLHEHDNFPGSPVFATIGQFFYPVFNSDMIANLSFDCEWIGDRCEKCFTTKTKHGRGDGRGAAISPRVTRTASTPKVFTVWILQTRASSNVIL